MLLRIALNNARNAAALLTLLPLALAACATPPSDPAARAEFDRTNDPFEPANRKIFSFNLFVDRNLLKPVATAYEDAVPEIGRDAIRHFLDNLAAPIVFANDMLQGEFKRAHDTAGRFLTNSTLGLGGFIDVATKAGLEKQTGDFGQTLWSWGVPDGPYLVLPILGPSNPRDAIGTGVDGFADPYGLAFSGSAMTYATFGRDAVNGVDERARNLQSLDELQRNAIDFYTELRSVFRQHRAAELRHGEPAPLPDLDNPDRDSLDKDPAPDPRMTRRATLEAGSGELRGRSSARRGRTLHLILGGSTAPEAAAEIFGRSWKAPRQDKNARCGERLHLCRASVGSVPEALARTKP